MAPYGNQQQQVGSPPLPPPPPVQSMGSTNTVFITETRLDINYLKTIPGVMKMFVIFLNILAFICVQSSAFRTNGRGVYFSVVAHLGLWYSLSLLFCYLFHVVEKYHNFKWLKMELVSSVVLTFLNLMASTVAVAYGDPGYSAAGFFGYLAMLTYGFEAFLKARALQAGELAQGRRVVSKQQHVTTPPA